MKYLCRGNIKKVTPDLTQPNTVMDFTDNKMSVTSVREKVVQELKQV